MKKIVILCLTAIMAVGLASAKGNKKSLRTTTFGVELSCQNCVNTIENNVPTLGKGIDDVKVNLEQQEVTVTYDDSKNSDENIIRGFGRLNLKAYAKQTAGGTEQGPAPTCVMPPAPAAQPAQPCTGNHSNCQQPAQSCCSKGQSNAQGQCH